ncbi:putative membrane protein SpoIIM required for sporulation [Chitinophaga skermanii]|uniref:Putative membrane protein SpoIIM required for sporulation n=1 Tax=Chitinophaga skermanii TaxID=331697 RepID=A0A327QIX8_9BACT|nr:stage II sporulation protein M [Chitinophaga skermanii]RAJ01667.1 putative membrane protein SpoIIM required for sporulation [Chitinophaga skermanii]
MRESLFIKRNLERWKKYQEQPTNDPDEMAERFTSLVDDLAYAKTFYSYSKITRYLNTLAGGIYQSIYANTRGEPGKLKRIFLYNIPLIVAKYRKIFLFTLAFFVLVCTISAFSAAHDDSFVRGILGDDYVDMTEQNIASGDPFGVYKDQNEMVMWLRIMFNNVQIALFTFVSGIFLGIGVVYILLTNGFMLGAFQYMFFAKGLGWSSILVIWIHGTLEISAIVLAGSAGFIMGYGILFPGTHKRVDSLKRAAKEGLKILVSVVPLLVVAAFLEGYVTRHTDMPKALSIFILFISLCIIVGYYVVLPFVLHRQGYSLDEAGKVCYPKKNKIKTTA